MKANISVHRLKMGNRVHTYILSAEFLFLVSEQVSEALYLPCTYVRDVCEELKRVQIEVYMPPVL